MLHKRAPKRLETIIRIVKAVRYLKGACKGRYHLGARAFRQKQRGAKRRVQLHIATWVSALGGPRKRLLDPTATFLPQRQVHPQRYRSHGQRYAA